MDGMRRHVWYEMAWYGMGHRPSPAAALVHRRRSSSPPSLPSLSDPLVADRCRRARATTPPRSRTQKGRAQLAQLEKKGTATQRVATPAIVTVCTSERPACGSKNLRRPGRAAPVALTKSPEPKAWTESLDRKPGPGIEPRIDRIAIRGDNRCVICCIVSRTRIFDIYTRGCSCDAADR